jgi:hypothetical protein
VSRVIELDRSLAGHEACELSLYLGDEPFELRIVKDVSQGPLVEKCRRESVVINLRCTPRDLPVISHQILLTFEYR